MYNVSFSINNNIQYLTNQQIIIGIFLKYFIKYI